MTQTIETEAREETPTSEPSVQDEEESKSRASRMAQLDPTRLVEAALFTAGRPVGVDELAEATGLSHDVVKQAARSLEQEYEETGEGTALEVSMAGSKWAMQLKTVYVEHAQSLARMEIPKKTLKTLALIAFHQPLLQSELVDMIGSKTYDHVRELMETGLVKSRPEGLSRRLTTSPEFPEYFGIPATDTAEIRSYLAKKVGLPAAVLRGETDLDAFSGEPASPEEVDQAVQEKEAAADEGDAPDADVAPPMEEERADEQDASDEEDAAIGSGAPVESEGEDDPEDTAQPVG